MPYVIRSKGTKAAIKALMNSAGINMDTTFRMKEYGGAIKKKILVSRKKKEAQYKYLDFTTASYMQSKRLKAFRHEPGAPDPASGPSKLLLLLFPEIDTGQIDHYARFLLSPLNLQYLIMKAH